MAVVIVMLGIIIGNYTKGNSYGVITILGLFVLKYRIGRVCCSTRDDGITTYSSVHSTAFSSYYLLHYCLLMK